MKIIKTTSQNLDFQILVNQLDQYLSTINGEKDDFFRQYNKIDLLNNVIVIYKNETPVGCGAIKKYDENTLEIKRMYVETEHRGKGIAKEVLGALENWAIELGYEKCILETSQKMLDAVHLYKKCGYQEIPRYGQYASIETSVCFEKILVFDFETGKTVDFEIKY
jgi:putative acetyltransferase